MPKLKTHIFFHIGTPKTLCGIKDRDGIIFESGKKVTCTKCKKLRKEINKN